MLRPIAALALLFVLAAPTAIAVADAGCGTATSCLPVVSTDVPCRPVIHTSNPPTFELEDCPIG